MNCPICGQYSDSFIWGTSYNQNGDTIDVLYSCFCPHCDTDWHFEEYFWMHEQSPIVIDSPLK